MLDARALLTQHDSDLLTGRELCASCDHRLDEHDVEDDCCDSSWCNCSGFREEV